MTHLFDNNPFSGFPDNAGMNSANEPENHHPNDHFGPNGFDESGFFQTPDSGGFDHLPGNDPYHEAFDPAGHHEMFSQNPGFDPVTEHFGGFDHLPGDDPYHEAFDPAGHHEMFSQNSGFDPVTEHFGGFDHLPGNDPHHEAFNPAGHHEIFSQNPGFDPVTEHYGGFDHLPGNDPHHPSGHFSFASSPDSSQPDFYTDNQDFVYFNGHRVGDINGHDIRESFHVRGHWENDGKVYDSYNKYVGYVTPDGHVFSKSGDTYQEEDYHSRDIAKGAAYLLLVRFGGHT